MDEKYAKPKSFGQLLDLTFQLSKTYFKPFLLIMLIFMGPLYLIQALIQLASGVSFLREMGAGDFWFEQVLSSFDPDADQSFATDISTIVVGFLSIFILPVAQAAIIIAIDHIRKKEDYSIKSVILKAFKRYGYILASTVLVGIIIFSLFFIVFIFIFVVALLGALVNPIVSVILSILLFLGAAVGIGFFLTKLSFFFGSVVVGDDALGFSNSWKLTKGRTWSLLGLFIVLSLIVSCVSYATEITFSLLLGNSVLLSMIVGIVSIITSLIFVVGYAVMFFDLKIRNGAEDLEMMIDDFKTVE